jgi:type VI secretion system protein ImpA
LGFDQRAGRARLKAEAPAGDYREASVTVEEWLQPISSDSPCGPNLEYDPDFQKLEETSRDKPDQEFGKDGGAAIRIQGAAANWSEVRNLAEGLLARSKDLRIAVYLCRALLRTDGFAGIGEGLVLIQRLLEDFWDSGLHPELDADDDNDPTMRINALVPLGALDSVAGDLRASFVMRSRSRGQLTVKEIEIGQGRLQAGAEGPALTESQLAGLLAAAVEEDPGLPQLAADALAHVKRIEAFIAERLGESFAPDFKHLQVILYCVAQALGKIQPGPSVADDALPGESCGETTSGGGRAAAVAGQIRSREDVLQTLERLCEYLSVHEPTNPVQLVLRRAQRMMNMSFLELMQDLAPDGLLQAETVVGERLNKEEEE